jgi:hypothetical protein
MRSRRLMASAACAAGASMTDGVGGFCGRGKTASEAHTSAALAFAARAFSADERWSRR